MYMIYYYIDLGDSKPVGASDKCSNKYTIIQNKNNPQVKRRIPCAKIYSLGELFDCTDLFINSFTKSSL